MQTVTSTVCGAAHSPDEYQQIENWLKQRMYASVGALFFLAQSCDAKSGWQLIRQYHVNQPKQLSSVAVLRYDGTCFWVMSENTIIPEILNSIIAAKPRRIMTSGQGREQLELVEYPLTLMTRSYDQWVMICQQTNIQGDASLATVDDIEQLHRYQRCYNTERNVNEIPDWQEMIAQQKVWVCRRYGQIVAVLKLGMQTDQIVTFGGTYTFPEHRQQGYAEQLVAFAVNWVLQQKKIAYLIVDQDNIAAIQLYQKIGFKIVSTAYVGYLHD